MEGSTDLRVGPRFPRLIGLADHRDRDPTTPTPVKRHRPSGYDMIARISLGLLTGPRRPLVPNTIVSANTDPGATVVCSPRVAGPSH